MAGHSFGDTPVEINVSTIQMESRTFAVEENLDRAGRLISEASRQRPELILLPELFYVGYSYEPKLGDYAEELDGLTVEWLQRASRRHGSYIGTCIIERDAGKAYNTFVLACPTGELHTYRKRNLPLYEKLHFTPGIEPGIFDTELGRIGVLVCWDMVYPKTVRDLAGNVDLLLISSAWPDMTTANIQVPFIQGWMTRQVLQQPAKIAKKLEVPVVFSNHTGTFETRLPYLGLNYRSLFASHSAIHERDGSALQRLSWGTAVLNADVQILVDPSVREATA